MMYTIEDYKKIFSNCNNIVEFDTVCKNLNFLITVGAEKASKEVQAIALNKFQQLVNKIK